MSFYKASLVSSLQNVRCTSVVDYRSLALAERRLGLLAQSVALLGLIARRRIRGAKKAKVAPAVGEQRKTVRIDFDHDCFEQTVTKYRPSRGVSRRTISTGVGAQAIAPADHVPVLRGNHVGDAECARIWLLELAA